VTHALRLFAIPQLANCALVKLNTATTRANTFSTPLLTFLLTVAGRRVEYEPAPQCPIEFNRAWVVADIEAITESH
jgi:hypothetical protein